MQVTLLGESIDDVAIQYIKEYEPKEGYYLAFSGGKDSVVIYDLAVRAGVRFDAHFSRTTVDPPEVLSFIRDHYPGVVWEKPRKSMYRLIRDKGMLPTRVVRFCCAGLKEIGGGGRIVLTGLRKDEGSNRRDRGLFEESKRVKGKWFLNPIIEWSTADVWEYIRERGLPVCKLYGMGYERIGCIMCPLQTTKGMLRDIERYPNHYRAYRKVIQELMDKGRYSEFKDVDEVVRWWIGKH